LAARSSPLAKRNCKPLELLTDTLSNCVAEAPARSHYSPCEVTIYPTKQCGPDRFGIPALLWDFGLPPG